MAGLTTSANFTPGENVGATELNAIIAGASLTHDAIDGLSNVGFDTTGQYMTSVGSSILRKVSGQQIVDGVAGNISGVTNRPIKSPPDRGDLVNVYDSASASMKAIAMSDFFRFISGSVTPGGAPLGSAAIVLSTPFTGSLLALQISTVLNQRALIGFMVVVGTPGTIGTGWDIQIGRDDGTQLFRPTVANNTPPPINSVALPFFYLAHDPVCKTGTTTYRLHMAEATNPMTLIQVTGFVATY